MEAGEDAAEVLRGVPDLLESAGSQGAQFLARNITAPINPELAADVIQSYKDMDAQRAAENVTSAESEAEREARIEALRGVATTTAEQAEETATTQDEALVVDTAATEDLITEEAKVESDDKKSPTIRPKLRPDDLRVPAVSGDLSSLGGVSAPSSFDDRIVKMLEEREKEADADKWMALAQTGLALMSSKQPTLGGAIGEAGQAGLGYLAKSKKGLKDFKRDMLKLETTRDLELLKLANARDIANIRAAAAGKGSSSAALTTSRVILKELLTSVENRLAQIETLGGNIPADKVDDYNRLIEERKDIIEEMRKLTPLGSSDNTGNSGLSGTFDVPSKP